jgi:hypothetical protein
MRSKSVIMLMALFFCLNLTGADKESTEPDRGIPVSKFIPGVYQLLSGKTLKGGVLLAACLGTIAGAIIENNQGNDYYEQYLQSTEINEIVELRGKAEKSFRSRNYYILGICAVWLVHVLDMKIFGTKKGVIKGEAKNNSIRLGFYYYF